MPQCPVATRHLPAVWKLPTKVQRHVPSQNAGERLTRPVSPTAAFVDRIAASPRFVAGSLKVLRSWLLGSCCLAQTFCLVVTHSRRLSPGPMLPTKGLHSPQPSVASVCNVLSFDSSPTGLLRGL
jgi:hypothetical protein